MKKYVIETYYTCTFKTVHELDKLDDIELSKIDQRTDGSVEVIDVKLNNRKTKKIGDKKDAKQINKKIEKNFNEKNINPQKIHLQDKSSKESSINLKIKNKSRFKMPDRRKGNDRILSASSILDYVFRELAISYLGKEELAHTPSIASSKIIDQENGEDKFLKIVKNITSKGFVRSNYEEKLVDLSDIRINLKTKN